MAAYGNPFYVDPSNDISQGLRGLGQAIENYGEVRDERAVKARAEARFNEVQAAMKAAWESKDPQKMAEVSVMYPEAAKSMELAFGFTNDQTKEAAINTYRQVLSETDPQRRLEIMDSGIQRVAEFNGKPYNMINDRVLLRNNPEGAMQAIRGAYAFMDPQGYKAMFPDQSSGMSLEQRSFNDLIETIRPALDENGNFDPKKATAEQRAAAIKLRLMPGAQGSASITAASDPSLGRQVREYESSLAGEKATASEQGKSDVQLEMQPQITTAVEDAKAASKSRAAAQADIDLWETSKAGLIAAFPDAQTLFKEAPGSSLSNISGKLLSKVMGNTTGQDAQAKIAQYGALLLQSVPIPPGAQSEAELNNRRETIGQLNDPNISVDTKKMLIDNFMRFQDAKIQAAREKMKQSAAASKPQANEMDEALIWARQNPDDPRAQAILQRLEGGR